MASTAALDRVLAPVRHRAATQLQARVAGPDASSRAERIWRSPGDRWFTPDDPIWRVHYDASMFTAGIRALLLQSLHPLAMAGVSDHSGYQGDPWGRLQRTSFFISTTTFGTVPDAERLLARIRGIHRRVSGVAPDGRPYRADDPHLLAWVHAAEADSFLACYRAFGQGALSDAEADEYVRQIGTIAARLGVLSPPQSVAELDATLAAYRPELSASDQALSAARYVMTRPPMPLVARPGYATLVAGAVGMLPAWARQLLNLPVPGAVAAPLRLVGQTGTATVRWLLADPEIAKARRNLDS